MIKKGDEHRAMFNISDDFCLKYNKIKFSSDKNLKLTKNDERILKNGDIGQGDGLNNKKYIFRK
jgi:hypothetical protein